MSLEQQGDLQTSFIDCIVSHSVVLSYLLIYLFYLLTYLLTNICNCKAFAEIVVAYWHCTIPVLIFISYVPKLQLVYLWSHLKQRQI